MKTDKLNLSNSYIPNIITNQKEYVNFTNKELFCIVEIIHHLAEELNTQPSVAYKLITYGNNLLETYIKPNIESLSNLFIEDTVKLLENKLKEWGYIK